MSIFFWCLFGLSCAVIGVLLRILNRKFKHFDDFETEYLERAISDMYAPGIYLSWCKRIEDIKGNSYFVISIHSICQKSIEDPSVSVKLLEISGSVYASLRSSVSINPEDIKIYTILVNPRTYEARTEDFPGMIRTEAIRSIFEKSSISEYQKPPQEKVKVTDVRTFCKTQCILDCSSECTLWKYKKKS